MRKFAAILIVTSLFAAPLVVPGAALAVNETAPSQSRIAKPVKVKIVKIKTHQAKKAFVIKRAKTHRRHVRHVKPVRPHKTLVKTSVRALPRPAPTRAN